MKSSVGYILMFFFFWSVMGFSQEPSSPNLKYQYPQIPTEKKEKLNYHPIVHVDVAIQSDSENSLLDRKRVERLIQKILKGANVRHVIISHQKTTSSYSGILPLLTLRISSQAISDSYHVTLDWVYTDQGREWEVKRTMDNLSQDRLIKSVEWSTRKTLNKFTEYYHKKCVEEKKRIFTR